jgi:hypothetical protein
MDAENLMVDQALDEIEGAPTGDHAAQVERPAGREPSLSPLGERHDAGTDDEQPRRHVKEPVGHGVDLQPGERGEGVLLDIADHVVPLQDLVQHDSVDEPAQPDPVEQASGPGRTLSDDGCRLAPPLPSRRHDTRLPTWPRTQSSRPVGGLSR